MICTNEKRPTDSRAFWYIFQHFSIKLEIIRSKCGFLGGFGGVFGANFGLFWDFGRFLGAFAD